MKVDQKPNPLKNVESAVGYVLLTGVVLSTLLMVGGEALTFFFHSNELSSPESLGNFFKVTQEIGSVPQLIPQLWSEALLLHGQSMTSLGLFILILTPVLRVAVSIVAFAVEKNWKYTAITSLVLLLLGFAFRMGATG